MFRTGLTDVPVLLYRRPMRDNEIVAAIVASDLDGLAEAYDKYAAGLYGYCRSLLREPADAADAVQDTFVVAASKVGELRDPSKLRPWLYAVARNECHRRLRAGNVSAMLEETAHVVDETADVSQQAEQAQLRELVHAAITGLNPGDQEVIELTLRHELQGDDLADALGVPRNHAHALLSRARHQLSTSLGALLVARGGRLSGRPGDGPGHRGQRRWRYRGLRGLRRERNRGRGRGRRRRRRVRRGGRRVRGRVRLEHVTGYRQRASQRDTEPARARVGAGRPRHRDADAERRERAGHALHHLGSRKPGRRAFGLPRLGIDRSRPEYPGHRDAQRPAVRRHHDHG